MGEGGKELEASKRDWGWRIVGCLCGLMLLWFRKPQVFNHPQMWAEDAAVFFRGAYLYGAESLFERYAGYLHTIPRLVALFANAFAPDRTPEIFALACVSGYLWVSWFISGSRVNLSNRYILPSIIALSPVDGEVLLNLTNLQWTVAWLLIGVALARSPRMWKERIHDSVVTIGVGLSGLFSIFFFPSFVLKWWYERSGWSIWLIVLNILCGGVQIIGFSSGQRVAAVAEPIYADYWRMLGRPLYSLGFGPLSPLVQGLIALQIVLGVIMVAALIVVAVHSLRTRNTQSLSLICGAILIWAAVLVSFRGNPSVLLWGGARYFYLQLPLMFAALVSTGVLKSRASHVVIGGYLLLLSLHFTQYQEPPLREMRWKRQLRCLFEREQNRQVTEPKPMCRIYFNPPGWYVDLPPKEPRLSQRVSD